MPEKPRITLKDVARVAGVSPKSISRVINDEGGVSEETRQRIQEAISSLGYVANPVARRLRGASNVIGLVVSGFEDYAGQILRGISQSSQHLRYNVILYVQHTQGQPLESYQSLIASGLIGGLLMIVPYDYDILIELCETHQLPYVMVDFQGHIPAPNTPTITVTNKKGIHDAMRYLLALGHERIAFITGLMDMASARERLRGYREALEEVGLPYDESLVVDGDWTQIRGFEQSRDLLKRRPDLTAIMASDDLTAFGAMDAIKDAGLRVGEDVSVIGFDDIPMASSVYPALTTIRQPMIRMGETAVELLVALLEDRAPINLHREFGTELVIRQSTGKPSLRAQHSGK